jgi:protein-L-isoaspartate(D-aspartate) O-methyltransferase
MGSRACTRSVLTQRIHRWATVIHVGAGTGYYTAILAHLVGPEGRVHAYEIEADIAARAAENLAGYPNVRVYAQSALGTELARACSARRRAFS